MKTTKTLLGAALFGVGGLLTVASPALADGHAPKSGYDYATPETRMMQDEDINNPGFIWVDEAEEAWSEADGKAGKSCMTCHNDATSMKGVSVTYPKYDQRTQKLKTLEDQINWCRTEQMGAEALKWESDAMLGMTAFISLQSRGMPMNVAVDGSAAPFFEKGKEFYFQRRGLYDMACSHCHVDNNENTIRAELLSQGMPNGFPTYRIKWQKMGSLHRRFTGCNKNIRAEPFKRGSDEYTNLELFVKWRARGLPSEAPSVRK